MRKIILGVAVGVLLVPAQVLLAADDDERIYLEEEYETDDRNWSIGISLGLVELGDNVIEGGTVVSDDDVEPYFTLQLRIPFGYRSAHSAASSGGFRGYLEPEIGFWDGDISSDTLVGLNIVGGIPFNAVEFFVGGGLAVHFVDMDSVSSTIDDESDSSLGANAHFGVDVSVSDSVSFYGVGRFDLVDDDRDELEGKALVGIRFRF